MKQDRTGQLWELYSYCGGGWICLIIGPPLDERGRNNYILHPMVCLQCPSIVKDPSDYFISVLSSDGRMWIVLEEEESAPWEDDKAMERLV